MRALSFLLPVTFCFLWFSGRCPAQDDPLAVTLPSGRVVHFATAEQKEKFEAARSAQAARAAGNNKAPAPKTADQPPAASAPGAASPSTMATPLPGTPLANISAPTFTADYYKLPQSGAWVGRKVTLALAYIRQLSKEGETPVRFTAYTWNSRPGSASEHMEGGQITLMATESAARKLIVQCGTQYRYTASGMTITMIHGVVQPLEGGKEYGVYVDY